VEEEEADMRRRRRGRGEGLLCGGCLLLGWRGWGGREGGRRRVSVFDPVYDKDNRYDVMIGNENNG